MRWKEENLGTSICPGKLGGETHHRQNRILLRRRYHRRHLLSAQLSCAFVTEAE
jgi:hypothetical protein